MVESNGERIIRAIKLIKKSTVKKTTGPNCGQNASATLFCRTAFKYLCSPGTFFLRAMFRISPSHKIKSSSFTTHESGSQPQGKLRTATKAARRKRSLQRRSQRIQTILNYCRKYISGSKPGKV